MACFDIVLQNNVARAEREDRETGERGRRRQHLYAHTHMEDLDDGTSERDMNSGRGGSRVTAPAIFRRASHGGLTAVQDLE